MAADDVETATYSIEGPDGETDEVTIPRTLVDAFAEEGQHRTQVVGDVLLMSFVGRAHSVVHHSEGEVSPELEEAEQAALDLFEERFGVTYAEATGHSH